ncbi:MAG: ATP-binding cassette domain-containing protein, partial [Candidatus Thermoplasmatota archaeon]|nr:ATP-binding cassette domain-containing protein [Candidatus Thermoplasmatota archaeon]
MADTVIDVRDVSTTLGGHPVHRSLNLSVARGEVIALIGGSGTGKSVLLREIIGLLRPQAGRIELFGQSVWNSTPEQMNALRRRFGVLFQDGALFSSLSVEDNVHRSLNLSVTRGEVIALIGGSGTGKSVLLREIIGLLRPQAGRIELFGQSV